MHLSLGEHTHTKITFEPSGFKLLKTSHRVKIFLAHKGKHCTMTATSSLEAVEAVRHWDGICKVKREAGVAGKLPVRVDVPYGH